MKTLLHICFILLCYVTINHAQAVGLSTDAVDESKRYLLRFGYLDKFAVSPKVLQDGITRLQHFANLKETGVLDAATLKQMTIPRCGLEDPKISVKRSRRYVHQGTTWKKNLLTWRLEGRGRTLDSETIRKVFRKATKFWSDEADMTFKEVNDEEPDIWVKFVTRRHGDPYAFDGKGGTLAHAFYPHNNVGLSGDVHFDDEEDYTVDSEEGRNLLFVATHELGHTLGLEHSNIQEAVMYPWYVKYTPGFKLNYDDVVGIQTLYGSRRETTTAPVVTTTTTTTTTKATKTRPIPSDRPCPISPLSAIYYNTYAQLTVILNSKKLYFVKQKGGIRYGPARLYNYLPKIRIAQPIDAALNTDVLDGINYTIFFAGTSYYLYRSFGFRSGPHSIHGSKVGDSNPLNLNFPASVRNIDAAITWHQNGRIYLFSGRYYWRYDNDAKKLEAGYPKTIESSWMGLPKKIDAAYSSDSDKRTFFVSGNQYYLYNDINEQVENGYPEHIGREWLNCGGRSSLSASGV